MISQHDGPVSSDSSQANRTGRPPATSRTQILAAARRVIERDGWDRLTLRRLATELAIGTTTLYHHVRDREDLLIQLINQHVEQTFDTTELPTAPQERIVAAAVAIHDCLADWPWAAEVLSADGFLGRLGQSALGMVEAIVAAGVDCGMALEQAVDLFRNLWYFTVGEILVRAHSSPERARERAASPTTFFANLDSERMPHLAAVGNQWPGLAIRDTYADAVRALVTALLPDSSR